MQQQDCWFSPKSICKHLGTTIRTRIRSYSNDPLMLSSAPAWVRELAPGRSVEGVSYFRCVNHSHSQNCDLRTWGSQLERWDVSVHQTCQTVWHMSNIVQQHCKHPVTTSNRGYTVVVRTSGSSWERIRRRGPMTSLTQLWQPRCAQSSTTRQPKKTQKSLEVGVRFSQSSQIFSEFSDFLRVLRKYWMCWVVENQKLHKIAMWTRCGQVSFENPLVWPSLSCLVYFCMSATLWTKHCNGRGCYDVNRQPPFRSANSSNRSWFSMASPESYRMLQEIKFWAFNAFKSFESREHVRCLSGRARWFFCKKRLVVRPKPFPRLQKARSITNRPPQVG